MTTAERKRRRPDPDDARAGAADIQPRPHASTEADTVVRLLRGVERLPEGATGALLFGDRSAPMGTLLVENKRVCWATASGMERRLTDILMEQAHPPIPHDAIEAVYEECRENGTPLGAALVAKGVVGPAGFERALRLHTGEAVSQLSRALGQEPRISPHWVANRARRYDAQFTFTPAEILVCVGSMSDPESTALAHRNLEPILEDDVVAAAFFDSRGGLPVAQVNGERLGVRGLLELGAWARHIQGATGFAKGERLVSATTRARETVVAWTSKGVLYTALCPDRSSLSVLFARRARAAAQERQR